MELVIKNAFKNKLGELVNFEEDINSFANFYNLQVITYLCLYLSLSCTKYNLLTITFFIRIIREHSQTMLLHFDFLNNLLS